jgi:hypothetical protein
VNRKTITAATAIALVCSLRVLGAESADDIPPACELNVRSQSLDGALQEVARQCGVQVLYFSDITIGKTAANLNGRYAIDDALHLLLTDSGLPRISTAGMRSTMRCICC